MNFLTEWFSGLNHVTKKALAFTLAGIIVFSVGFAAGTYSNVNATLNSPELLSNYIQATPTEQTTQSAPQTEPSTQPAAPSEPAQSEPSQSESSAPSQTPAEPSDNAGTQAGTLSTPEEILNYFNESANKIKTNATSVTRNWEDLHSDDEYLVVPSALQSIGKTLMSTFLKKDETPLVWGSQEEIIANYPVKTQTYVSKATVADIAEATCQDDGTYYNITLKFKECTDPSGSGCDNAFNVIQSEEVMNAAKIVTKFSCKYYDAQIVCKVEKATGNMVSATYTLPIVMQVTAKVIKEIDAQVGMTFIDDYSISY